jgi:hypothetical protein
MLRFLVTANILPNSPILVTLNMKAIHSSETSVLTRARWHSIPEDGILHSHHHGNLKSYKNRLDGNRIRAKQGYTLEVGQMRE